MTKVICTAGMPGSGKSTVADYFVKKGYQFIRFGQVVLDEAKRRGVSGERAEKKIREGLRKRHGKAAIAKLLIPQINKMLKNGNVVADGLYSLTEYKVFRDHFGEKFILIAVYAPPELRYERISKRKSVNDPKLRNRPFTKKEAKARDFAQLTNLETGGPIALADHTLLNTGSLRELTAQLEALRSEIE